MSKIYFCDTETHSLYGEICMFQYVTENGEPKYIEYPEPSYLIWFIKNHHTIFYNASYDLGTITHQAGEDVGTAIEMDDLFFAARTAYPELEKYSLDILHDKLGMQYYDQDLDKKKMQKSFTYAEAKKTRKATDDQIQYALADVLTLRDLYKQKKIQKVIKKNKAYKLDIDSLKYSVIYQRNGIPVDREALTKERADLVERIADNRETLGDLNPRSPKRVCEALGTPKSDKDTLVRLMSEGNELAKVIYEQRRLLKADKMLESWDFDRVHTFFNPAGTITGRFNSCLVGNSMIAAEGRSKKIKDLNVGDLVYTFTNDNKLTLKPVLKLYNNGKKKVVKIFWVDAGNNSLGELVCTADHKLRLFDGSYIKAEDSIGYRISYFRRHLREKTGRVVVTTSALYKADTTEEQVLKDGFFGESSSMHIHHLNHNPSDNRICNLKVVTKGEHTAIHNSQKTPSQLQEARNRMLGDKNHTYRHDLSKFSVIKALIISKGDMGKAAKYLGTDYSRIRDRFGKEYPADKIKRRFNNKGKLLSINSIRNAHHDSNHILVVADKLDYLTDFQRSTNKYERLYKLLDDYKLHNHYIVSIMHKKKKKTVYDIEVKDTHNYIANELGVHNSGGDVGMGYVNTQQISRQYQYMFHGTNGKTTTFEIDYSTAELRAGCSIMHDENMYKELKKGKDLHIEAARLTGIKNPTREDRQKGKAVSFGLIFSMSAKSFKEYAFVNYGVTFSRREAIAIHRAYHRKYKGISDYQSECWDTYDTVPKESAMGRRNLCRLGTDASNYSTQSSIAESTKWAVHFIVDEYPEALKYIVNVVHDAIYMEVPNKDFKMWSHRLEKAMLLGWEEICKSDLLYYKDIPMPVEVEIIGGD